MADTIHFPAPVDAVLKSAIAKKRLIEFRYGKHVRVLEPHDYGAHNGVKMLLAYQVSVADPRATGPKATGWRLFHVEKIESCSVLEDTFAGSRAASHQQHLSWDEVYARVR
jgi:hypothetical protein